MKRTGPAAVSSARLRSSTISGLTQARVGRSAAASWGAWRSWRSA
jgi:hypothetical protein